MDNRKKLIYKALQLVSFLIAYIFVAEIILPLKTLSYVLNLNIFLFYAAVIFLVYFLEQNKLIAAVFNLSAMLVAHYFLYKDSYTSITQWFKGLFGAVFSNTYTLFAAGVSQTTFEYRTIIFFIFLWIIIFSYAQFIKKMKGFAILLITVLVLSFVDSFLLYDAKKAIIRVIFLGLIFLAIEKQRQMIESTDEKIHSFSMKFIIVALSLSLFIISVGYITPKADPKWTDPIGWLQDIKGKGLGNGGNGGGIKKIGYSSDDSFLGGPFILDDTEVMETVSSKRLYWRGESKDYYNGHGWVSKNEENQKELYTIPLEEYIKYNFPYDLIYDHSILKNKEVTASVKMLNGINQIFIPGDISKINFSNGSNIEQVSTDVYTGKIIANTEINEYTVEAKVPLFDPTVLKELDTSYRGNLEVYYDFGTIPLGIYTYLKPYLELPSGIPNRVKKLAEEITSEYDNPYDKVTAIASYLRNNYSYETQNVPYPDKNKDLVDQFLFESKVGYCDHFSSAFVVLSREVGVPARWVKGYSEGDVTYNRESKLFEGVVRNRDAHSWAEVYFDEVGWISFEATPGFRFPQEYGFNKSEVEEVNKRSEVDSAEVTDNLEEIEDNNTTESGSEKDYGSIFGWIFVIVLLIGIGVFSHYELDVFIWWQKFRTKREKSVNRFILATTEKMISVVERLTKPREKSETIREYMHSIYSEKSKEVNEVVEIYEEARYSTSTIEETWKGKIWSLWLHLIKKLRS